MFIFSIYYTDKSVDILKLNDPIMKEIKNNLNKYKIESIDATINNNIIIPGKEGQEVDVKKTYDAMRKYGSYNENLIKIKEIIPTISINDNLDKYIKLNNSDNKKISLIFIINKEVNINNLNKTLEKNNITATFFIEKKLIENNINFIKNTNHQIELLNSNKILFNSTKSYLESLTNSKLKYCYTEEENNNILELCKVFAKNGGEGVAGLRMKADKGVVKSVKILGKEVLPDAFYTVATSDYLSQGNDGMVPLKNHVEVWKSDKKIRDLYIEYIKQVEKVEAKVDGRMDITR